MKKVAFVALAAIAISFTSCRDAEKSESQTIIEEARENGAEIEVSDDKVKIEQPNGDEVKIKTDDDGNVKIKTDDNN